MLRIVQNISSKKSFLNYGVIYYRRVSAESTPVDPVERIFSLSTANSSQLLQHQKQEAAKSFMRHEIDTGSAAVQIAHMSEKILALTKHFARNRKDHAGMRGFQALISRRRKMLKYLKTKDVKTYDEVMIKYFKRAAKKADKIEKNSD